MQLTINQKVQQLRAEADDLWRQSDEIGRAAKFKIKGPHWDEMRPLRDRAAELRDEANRLEAGTHGSMTSFVAGIRADVQIVCGTEYLTEADAVARSCEHLLLVLDEDTVTGIALEIVARLIRADANGQYREYQHCDARNAWAGLKDRATTLYGYAAGVQRAANTYLPARAAA